MTNVRSTVELLKSFDDFMLAVDWKKSPLSLYVPVEYILSLGGKRIRPLAIIFLTELLEGPKEGAMHAAYGLELFHNFSLIHDDIMDQAERRRSRDTVHKKFGINPAILSGDVMMIESMRFLRLAEQLSGKIGLQDLFIKTAREVCEGQALDMEFEKKSDISYAEYVEMIRLKTAVLLAFGFEVAALLSSREDLAVAFYNIGIFTGLAFQLEDDYLDFYATEMSFGKIKAGDILQAKKSALVLELMEQFDATQRNDFASWYQDVNKPEIRITVMEDYFKQYGIHDKLKDRITLYQNKVYDLIEGLHLTATQKLNLKDFILGIFSRKF